MLTPAHTSQAPFDVLDPATSGNARPRLASYELILELASGGMATVYVARRVGAAGFERLVVIKRIHRHLVGDETFHGMFIDEARVASQIRHPNVVSVMDVIDAEGELFLVMDYVESVSLATLLAQLHQRGERLPPAVAARIIADTLSGLHAAHEACDMQGQPLDVVHRDVSPQNIIVGIDGISRLIDFGIAKAARRITKTESGTIKGKFRYLAPEGVAGDPLDRRADLFSLGTVLYETLSGKPLFRGETELETLKRILDFELPTDPFVADAPPALDAVLRQALCHREERFQTGAGFLDALEAAVPLASASQVRAVVERCCGDRLAARRAALRGRLLAEATPKPAHEPDGSPASAASRAASLAPSTADSASSVPSVVASFALPTPSPTSAAAGDNAHQPSTTTQIAATADVSVGPRRRGRQMLFLTFGALFVLAVGALIWLEKGSAGPAVITERADMAKAMVAKSAPLDGPDPQSVPNAPATDDVELVLVGKQPIKSIAAEGLQRSTIEGSRARIVVRRWQGRLQISATLATGTNEIAYAEEGEVADKPLEVRLEPADTVAPRQPARAPGRQPPSAQARPPAAAPLELHKNPY